MAHDVGKNVGASVRARLLNRARAERADFQLLLTRYVLERLLYRLSVSPYRDQFVLKGAMLFTVWVDDPFRPTRDLDLLGFGDNSPEAIAEAFRAICSQPVEDDGVAFDIGRLEAAPIREDVEYGGVRVRTRATVAAAQLPVQIDIGLAMPSRQGLSRSTILRFSMRRSPDCAPIHSKPSLPKSSRHWSGWESPIVG